MRAHAPRGVSVGFPGGSQAPLTTAILLRGEGFLLDVLDTPELAHSFLRVLTTNSIAQREFARQVMGQTGPVSALGFTDDYGGLLGPNLYYAFDVRYMLDIARHFGAAKPRHSHGTPASAAPGDPARARLGVH